MVYTGDLFFLFVLNMWTCVLVLVWFFYDPAVVQVGLASLVTTDWLCDGHHIFWYIRCLKPFSYLQVNTSSATQNKKGMCSSRIFVPVCKNCLALLLQTTLYQGFFPPSLSFSPVWIISPDQLVLQICNIHHPIFLLYNHSLFWGQKVASNFTSYVLCELLTSVDGTPDSSAYTYRTEKENKLEMQIAMVLFRCEHHVVY